MDGSGLYHIFFSKYLKLLDQTLGGSYVEVIGYGYASKKSSKTEHHLFHGCYGNSSFIINCFRRTKNQSFDLRRIN